MRAAIILSLALVLPTGWSLIDSRNISLSYLSQLTQIAPQTLRQWEFDSSHREAFQTPDGLAFIIKEAYREKEGAANRLEYERQAKKKIGLQIEDFSACGQEGIITQFHSGSSTLHKIHFRIESVFIWIESTKAEISIQIARLLCKTYSPDTPFSSISTSVPPVQKKQPPQKDLPPAKTTAVIHIKNYDDDRMDIMLFRDGKQEGAKTLSSGEEESINLSVKPGPHNFKIEWKDPDLEKVSSVIKRVIIEPGKKKFIQLSTSKYVPAEVLIMVDNGDPQVRSVELFVDDKFENTYEVAPAKLNQIKTILMNPGKHKFELKWIQPLAGRSSESYRAVKGRAFKSGAREELKFIIHNLSSRSQAADPASRLKKLNIKIADPEKVYSIQLAGITPKNAARFQSDTISNIFGIGNYATPAGSWAEVAEFEFLHGQSALTQARRLGYFDNLHDLLEFANFAASLADALKNAPNQLSSLRKLKSAKELARPDNLRLFTEYTGNMAAFYDGAVKADKYGALNIGIPEIDGRIMMLISAAASGGWSLLGDLSKEIFSDKLAATSINYKFMKGLHCLLMAETAQKLHDITQKADLTKDDLRTFFDYAERLLLFKQVERRMDYRDAVNTWEINPDLTTRIFDGLGITNTKEVMNEKKKTLDYFLDLYKHAELYRAGLMKILGVN